MKVCLSELAGALSSQVCHQRGLLGNLRMYVTVLRIINTNKQLDKCGDTLLQDLRHHNPQSIPRNNLAADGERKDFVSDRTQLKL